MINKIPAWKCTVCKKIMVNRAEMEEHEKLRVVDPLPSGFVYFDKDSETYEVVRKKPGSKLENHNYSQEVISFSSGGNRLEIYRHYGCLFHYVSADHVRVCLGYRDLGRLFARFEKFRLMYSKLDPEIKREIGVQAKDLTNKLTPPHSRGLL